MVEFVEASFVTSAPDIRHAPENPVPNEVVFMARSNAGKSSLLNALANHKNLAKTSSTPGKTQLINFFDATLLDRESGEKRQTVLVDLPGFGYAKVSKTLKEAWTKSLTDFVMQREQIRLFIHLVDARHPNLEIDEMVNAFLESHAGPNQVVMRVFTKSDKLNQKELSALKRRFPGVLCVSSTKKRGIAQLSGIIYEILGRDIADD